MLRHGRHKYVRHLIEGELEELYDLTADPNELTNLAGDDAQGSLLAELRSMAVAEGAGFVDTMPAVGGAHVGNAR